MMVGMALFWIVVGLREGLLLAGIAVTVGVLVGVELVGMLLGRRDDLDGR